MNSPKWTRRDKPAYYRVYLQGVLHAGWSDDLHGMAVVSYHVQHAPPVTILSGELVDQAVLMGVLGIVSDLGLSLLAVECFPYREDLPVEANRT